MKKIVVILMLNMHYCMAGTIIVNSTGGGLGTAALCSLRAAINAANTDQPFSACPAGSGEDVIILPENGMFRFFEEGGYNVGPAALPTIYTVMTIEGNNSTITRKDDAPNMRFFNVSGGEEGFLTLRNMTLTGGYNPDKWGGAIMSYSSLKLDGVRVIDNLSGGYGGGIYCVNYYCEITNSEIRGNSGWMGDGVYAGIGAGNFSENGIKVTNSLFVDNSGTGLHIRILNQSLSIKNSTFSNNETGGLYIEFFPNSQSPTILENLTITGNNSGLTVGSTRTGYLKNSILSGNAFSDCISSAVESMGHNLIENNDCENINQLTDIENISAELLPLQDNGGMTMTHAIPYNSIAVDSGSDSCGDYDQRGEYRPQDGDNDGFADCDRGAVELINRVIFIDGFE